MLKFGKYKGRNLSDILEFDYQYIAWLVENVPNLEKRLDSNDFQLINKIANPYNYIQSKYNNFNELKEEKALKILKDEGLLQAAYQYIGYDDALHYTIETIYGCKFGFISAIYPSVIPESRNLTMIALQLMEDYSKKYFSKYKK
jgi:hypothetical protein